MKLLVLADSHGDVASMVLAVEREEPDMIVHLGDCVKDTEPLLERFPDIPFFRVPGNCDYCKERTEQLLILNGRRILICHGHTYGVKQGLWDVEEAVVAQKLDAFLFGHTHKPLVEMRFGALMFNPGSIGLGHPRTYGVMDIDEEGNMNARTVRSENLVRVRGTY